MEKKTPNPHASALGKLGGPARAKALTPERRKQIATKAAKARSKALTPAERRRIAMLGVTARQAKRKKGKANEKES